MSTAREGAWIATTLAGLCEVNPRKPKLTGLSDNTIVLFVPMAAVDEMTGTVKAPEDRPLAEVSKKSYRTFRPRDVLFAKITPCMENGKSAVVPEIPSGLGFGSTEFHVLRPKRGVNPRFIWHFVRQESFRRIAKSHMAGSVGQARVPAAFLESFPITVPDPATQSEVVRMLDHALDTGRSATHHLSAARQACGRFRLAILAAACSGRLTADWRADNRSEPVSPSPALSTAGAANGSGSPNTDELTEIPESWAWWPVEAITDRVIDYRGRTPPSESAGAIPHVRTTQIRDGRIDWATDRFVTKEIYDAYMTRGIPRRGDVLFTMEAPMGEVGVIDRDEPFSIAQRILLLRAGDRMIGEYLALALRSHPVRRAIEYRATGTGVLGVAYKRLRSVLLPTPPLGEQVEIVRRASQLLEYADLLQRRVDVASDRVGRSSQAVLAKAFRGELGTNGADFPGDG
jgi:type I restriction enzyme S subunit